MVARRLKHAFLAPFSAVNQPQIAYMKKKEYTPEPQEIYFGEFWSILYSRIPCPSSIAEFGPFSVAEFCPFSMAEFGSFSIAEFGPFSIAESL